MYMTLFRYIGNSDVLDYCLDYNYEHTQDFLVHFTNVDNYKYEGLD